MDFFEHQDNARRATGRLAALFVVAVVLIVLLVYLVALFAYHIIQWRVLDDSADTAPFRWWDTRVFLLAGAGTLIVIVAGSLSKISQLRRGGGAVVAVQLGGRPIARTTDDPLERRLVNVVDEMAIAAGLPSPPVYVLDRENSINAFAAGYEPSGAVVGVTRGAMERLSRDELQGVIAHEFSHILSGDMRLNIRLIGLLHGILIISILGYTLLRVMAHRPVAVSRDKDSGAAMIPLLIVGVGLVAIGSVGAFFGAMIKAAVSRQREYLADASAVQFTRNPSGISGALRKIGGVSQGARIRAPSAAEAGHIFFGQALTSGFSAMFATHPPLPVRIRRIDPSWDGEMLASEALRTSDPTTIEALKGFAGAAQATLLEQIGDPTPAHILLARERLAALPPEIHDAAQEPFAARALVLALVLSADRARREHQLGMVTAADQRLAHELFRLVRPVQVLPRELRLTVVDLALPALTQLTPGQEATFLELVRAVIGSDERIDLFEFCLERIVASRLDAHRRLATRSKIHYYALSRLTDECALLLTALARAGATDQRAVESAFHAGAGSLAEGPLTPTNPRDVTLSSLESAFEKLSRVAPRLKKRLIEACAAVVAHDHVVTPREGEFLRAIADSIDVPAPPLLPGQRLA